MKLKNLLKHVFLSTSFLFSSQLVLHAQCPLGGIYIVNQEDLDNFILDYPTCEVIDGYVYMNGTDIVDLSPLSNIKTINGSLNISSTSVTTLSGLENLTYVGGDLYIVYNDNLMNVHSLNNLDSIGGTLELYECALLNDLSGLSNLKSIHGGLLIGNCPLLENLNGLENLESLDGGINIFNNLSLTDISGIRNIDPTTVKDYLGIYGLNIQNNPLLSVCNYSNICAIKDLVGVSPDLTIIEISGNAGDCADLAALDVACLAPLSTHGIELIAKANASTVHVEWKVLSDPKPFTFNVQRSIDGQNWNTITSMPSSSDLQNPSYTFIDYTPNQGENYYRIQATNAEGDVFYSSMKYVDLGTKNQSIIFPNPAKDVITIQSLENESVIIKNMVGQTLLEAETNTKIDISSLPSGIYMILFESGESMKLIKD